jgi:6-pyruvoyltetrahydropterin/6-carboxytetrahydropterin synthase
VFYLTAEADELDDLGRVMDFGVLKTKLGGWIEEHWDHGFVLCREDMAARTGLDIFSKREGIQQKLFLLQDNPTAENLAKYILEFVGPQVLHGTGVRLTKVTVFETENGIAEASL